MPINLLHLEYLILSVEPPIVNVTAKGSHRNDLPLLYICLQVFLVQFVVW